MATNSKFTYILVGPLLLIPCISSSGANALRYRVLRSDRFSATTITSIIARSDLQDCHYNFQNFWNLIK